MGLFDAQHEEIRGSLSKWQEQGKVTRFVTDRPSSWPSTINKNLVMGADTAVELGDPSHASLSFLIWNDTEETTGRGQVTIVGPDLPETTDKKVSFGKIVVVNGHGFDEDNSYDRYQLLDQARYAIPLDGYMMRSASQYQREWSRVSKDALQKGFSFQVLGQALIAELLKNDFVSSVEVIFITSSKEDVLELKAVSEEVATRIGAMNKMADLMHVEDCDVCEYSDVCSDVEDLQEMRNASRKKERYA